MGNRFAQNEIKTNHTLTSVVPPVIQEETKDKYKVLLRMDGTLEEPIKQAAAAMGLPVTKYIELAVRRQLKDIY